MKSRNVLTPNDARTANIGTGRQITATGVKSESEKLSFLTRKGVVVKGASAVTNRVWPSAFARRTAWAARVELPPTRFSTTAGLPHLTVRPCPTRRAKVSVTPPAVTLTTSRIISDGNSRAPADGNEARHATPAKRRAAQ